MAANLPESVLTDLFEHFSLDSRRDVKLFALNYVLGLTGTKEGTKFIEEHPKLLERIAELTHGKSSMSLDVQKESYTFLLNASASPLVAEKLQELQLYEEILTLLLDKSCTFAENLAMLLSNLTQTEDASVKCLQNIEKSNECSLEQLFEALLAGSYNEHGALHHLAPFLSNMSRLERVRMVVLDRESGLVQRLLAYINYRESPVRRKGVVGILRNSCFEYDFHEWLLGDDVDILPSLLLPLAGPEEFSETETEKLPMDLQYLEETKRREPDPEIRKMLLETITLLCSKTFGRQYIKEKNTYVIIRELHKWETEDSVTSPIENLVQILIGDEPAPEMANLHEVVIPADVREKLEQCDQKKSH